MIFSVCCSSGVRLRQFFNSPRRLLNISAISEIYALMWLLQIRVLFCPKLTPLSAGAS
jgi:hypothetical protein